MHSSSDHAVSKVHGKHRFTTGVCLQHPRCIHHHITIYISPLLDVRSIHYGSILGTSYGDDSESPSSLGCLGSLPPSPSCRVWECDCDGKETAPPPHWPARERERAMNELPKRNRSSMMGSKSWLYKAEHVEGCISRVTLGVS